MEDVNRWINFNKSYGKGSGRGYGSGKGLGYGYGYGSGEGSSSGFGYGDGSGSGYGSSFGDGSSSDYGSSFGDGSGNGNFHGKNYGSDFNYGILKINGKNIYVIDDTPTIINHIKNNVAKGYILNNDLTMTSCYVIKGNGYFAHGESIREARDALVEKYMRNIDIEETINKFLSKFEKDKKYKGTEFFKWHNYLTGSCLIGRKTFVKNHQINLENSFTVEEFINLCKNDYGGSIIKELEKRWSEKYEEHD